MAKRNSSTQLSETTASTLYDPKNTLEQYITPTEVHWVDISRIDSFTIQNIVGTVIITIGMLIIAFVSQVDSSEEGMVRLKWAVEILSIFLILFGICLYFGSYLITLKRIKQSKRLL